MLGFETGVLESIGCDVVGGIFSTAPSSSGRRLVIETASGDRIFESRTVFDTAEAAMAAARRVYPKMRSEAGYVTEEAGAGRVRIGFATRGAPLLHRADFANEIEAVRAIHAIVEHHDDVLQASCDGSGLHVIEHLPLRPRVLVRNDAGDVVSPSDELLRLCEDAGCEGCGDEDPYSFRITVVLAGWSKWARTTGYRAFVEKTVREETPAHVHVRVCWIGNADMQELDRALRAWIEAQVDHPQTSPMVARRRSRVVEILQTMRTIHPAAVLHDCDDDGDENPVRLDSTSLGTL
jgi:hypothetical protein